MLVPMSRTNTRQALRVALAGAVAISLVAIGYAAAELSGGISEMHRHWWSAAPLATLAVASIAWLRLGTAVPVRS
jgi:hypothetical protein